MVTIPQLQGWYRFAYHTHGRLKIRVIRRFRKDKHGRLFGDTKKDGTAGKTADDYYPRCYRIDKIKNISWNPDPSAYKNRKREKSIHAHDVIIEILYNLKPGEDLWPYDIIDRLAIKPTD